MSIEFPERFQMADYFLFHNLEEGRENKTCLYYRDETYTYGDAARRTNRAGNALRELGVGVEDRVLLVLPDCPEFVWTWFAVNRVGGVITMVNPLLPADDYRYYLEYTRARAAVVHESVLENFAPAAKEARHLRNVLVVGGGGGGGFHSFSEVVGAQSDELTPADTHRDDIAIWLFTSGSTGHPKGAVHLQHDLPYTCQTYAAEVLGIGEGDVCLSTTKLFHAYGLGNSLSFPFWVGATAVQLYGRPAPDRVLDAVERHRPTLLFSVPTLYNAMLASPGASRRDLSSVRLCVSAAESLPAEIWRRWHDTYGLVILDGIGSTELLHIFCSNTPERLRPGSSGIPVPGYDLKLLGDEGEPVPQGETGTLYVRGDSAQAGYWRQHDKTKQTVLGDWVWTGDRYRRDGDGFFWHQGRVDDMLKVGGLWVSPVEMEQALAEHPAVYECAVVQVLVDGLTRIKAVVVCREADAGQLTAELQAWCKQRLQRHEFPHIVEYTEELPKTTTGKIQRFKLRDAPMDTGP